MQKRSKLRSATASQRKNVRFAISEMPDEDWKTIRKAYYDTLTHELRYNELEVCERVLRGDATVGELDEVEPELTRDNAKGLVYNLVNRIAGTPELMSQVQAVNKRLNTIPMLSREQMRWALLRMPQNFRDETVKLVAANPELEVRDRDRRLTHDMFDEGLSAEEVRKRYPDLTVHGVKATAGTILTGLTKRPLACQLAWDYIAAAAKVESPSVDEVRERMGRLRSKDRRDILWSIPSETWRPRSAAESHRQIALEYFGGTWSRRDFVATYNSRHPETNLQLRAADGAIDGVIRRIIGEPGRGIATVGDVEVRGEPQVVDELRALTDPKYRRKIALGEPRIHLAPQAVEAQVQAKPVEAEAAVAGETHATEAKPVDPHLKAVLSGMVGGVKDFCSDTNLSEDFLFNLDLKRLRGVFTINSIKPKAALDCIASVMFRQKEAGEILLTADGIDSALKTLQREGFGIGELRKTAGPALSIVDSPSKHGRSHKILQMNPDLAAEITDETLGDFAEGFGPAQPATSDRQPITVPQTVVEEVVEIPLKEAPEEEPLEEEPAPPLQMQEPSEEEAPTPLEAPEAPLEEVPKSTPPAEAEPPTETPEIPEGTFPPQEEESPPAQAPEALRLQAPEEPPTPPEEVLGEKPPEKEPAPPEPALQKPPEKPPEEETPPAEEAPMTFEEFDCMLNTFRAGFKDRGTMMKEAGLQIRNLLKPSGPYGQLRKSDGPVREQGEKIIACLALFQIGESKVQERGRAHLEESFNHWVAEGVSEDGIPRLALYRSVASAVGLGGEYSELVDDLTGKAETGEIAEEVIWKYAEAEQLYLNIVNAVAPPQE
ncbi:MAG: hypothetical protein ABH851_05530 [Methanobacteriota archaeon]